MIRTRAEYLEYLEADRIALGKPKTTVKTVLIQLLNTDVIYDFQRSLRRLEYIKNCKQGIIYQLFFGCLTIRFRIKSRRLGFSIPLNVFGPGLSIVHYGTIVVNANAKVGANCRIHPSTCIGASGGSSNAPNIGDNVYIAPGVKIYGDITLANNIATAANAAVNKSFEEENILIGGVPARRIKSIDITKIIKHLSLDK